MNFSIANALSHLGEGLRVIEKLSALASSVGAPTGMITTIAKMGGALLETATNIKTRVDEGKVVATEVDQTILKNILADIRAKNDELMAYIEAH